VIAWRRWATMFCCMQRVSRRLFHSVAVPSESLSLGAGELRRVQITCRLPAPLPPTFYGASVRFVYFVQVTCRVVMARMAEGGDDDVAMPLALRNKRASTSSLVSRIWERAMQLEKGETRQDDPHASVVCPAWPASCLQKCMSSRPRVVADYTASRFD
jgi:hypothetical protein